MEISKLDTVPDTEAVADFVTVIFSVGFANAA
jgi:hypothetical protein